MSPVRSKRTWMGPDEYRAGFWILLVLSVFLLIAQCAPGRFDARQKAAEAVSDVLGFVYRVDTTTVCSLEGEGKGYVLGWASVTGEKPEPNLKTKGPVRFMVEFSERRPTDVYLDQPGTVNVLTIMRDLQARHDLGKSAEYPCYSIYYDAQQEAYRRQSQSR